MKTSVLKNIRRARRKIRVRKAVHGTTERPRLSVFRSVKHIYAQIIDDTTGKTLASASSVAASATGGNKSVATAIGKDIAEKAKAAGIALVCFDRNGFRYHGRVKALADGAREGGLKF
ncbi:MAG: 50S ribosomal protein L18 [Phycisphaeraceae bacterium]